MTAAIKPVLKYPGSKARMASWIVSQFPIHTHYLEPYFGSGVVFFNKPPAAHEVINDLDDNVVNLFRVIREHGAELAALIEMTPWARAEYELCKNERSDDPIEQARRFVVQCWQGHSSAAGGRGSGWKNGGLHGADQMVVETWQRVPARVRAVIERLRSVEIEHRPALEVIERYAAPETLIYADPPYPKSTRNGKLYVEDSMTDADHLALLDVLDAHQGPVVLSGYACELYDHRLRYWTRRTLDALDTKGQRKIEVLWLNPVCAERFGYGPMFEVV
jgi:DNA adenine methylase